MCGIVGYIGQRDAAPLILESLRKLEYRGYDSAGIAVLHDSRVSVRRAEGKLNNLAATLERQPMTGTIGIGHTRWATHGRPSENNAHPHSAGDIVVVHNGIIENYLELKQQLIKRGTHFTSETDSEIVAHLVAEKVARGVDFLVAVQRTLREIQGSYALLFLNRRDPTRMIVAKNSTPIVIGAGDGEMFIASDIPALLDYTRKVAFLEDGEIGEVTVAGFRLFDGKGKRVKRPVKQITWDAIAAQKGGYPHFMLKEIHDQPRALADTFRGRIALKDGNVALEDIKLNASAVKQIKRIHLVACGTAWHACLVGKFLLEEIAGIPAEVDYGSEFRYRSPLMDPKSILLMVSQSGETADTLAATDIARAKKAKILSICNVIDSSIPRKSHGVLYTHAGPEISVASTKAFTTQLTALYLLAIALGRMNGKLKSADARKLLRDLMHLPTWIEEALKLEPEVRVLARDLLHSRDFLYLGRGINYP
ncbi:MAG TPA: glutamine--fructose-6-phosphate transaminase (isomerizing), partial [Candidatus Deferrimicrobium sp.]|nr:glutamine--fructose-6-phosphate transaminase (isomerizing) [Candidatus Deferrimicrobium sp.]